MTITYAANHPQNQRRIFVHRGESGFSELRPGLELLWEMLHERQRPAETAAALAGSMYGWECPAAREAGAHTKSVVLDIDGQRMLVKYTPHKCGGDRSWAVDHFEFHSPYEPARRIAVSETGYLSYFMSCAQVAEHGSVEVAALAIVHAIVGSHATKQTDDRQAQLF